MHVRRSQLFTSQMSFDSEKANNSVKSTPDTSKEGLIDQYKESMMNDDDKIGEGNFQKWIRPEVNWSMIGPDLRFMLIDTDFGLQPLGDNKCPKLGAIDEDQSYSYVRLYGLTKAGNSVCCNVIGLPCKYEVCEENINQIIRFHSKMSISGCSWLKILNDKYIRRDGTSKLTHAQIEVDVSYKNLCPLPEERSVSPLRILSLDIEVMTKPPMFLFPRNGAEQILQIGSVLSTFESSQETQTAKFAFTLKSCNDVLDVNVFSYEKEENLLNAWRCFVIAADPDIITGYNVEEFDLPYLVNRANRIGKKTNLPFLGRLKNSKCIIRPTVNQFKGCSNKAHQYVNMPGRVVFDMMHMVMRHNTNPRKEVGRNLDGEFTLKEVAKRYLHESKLDVHYTEIWELFHEGPETRRKLAMYCVQDALLPYYLMLKLVPEPTMIPSHNVLINYIEKSRAIMAPMKYLVNKSIHCCNYNDIICKTTTPSMTSSCSSPAQCPDSSSTLVRQVHKELLDVQDTLSSVWRYLESLESSLKELEAELLLTEHENAELLKRAKKLSKALIEIQENKLQLYTDRDKLLSGSKYELNLLLATRQ